MAEDGRESTPLMAGGGTQMSISKHKLEIAGFEQCEFGPDSDPCDSCGERHRQLYFGNRCYFEPRDGDHFCGECVLNLVDQIIADTAPDFTIHNP